MAVSVPEDLVHHTRLDRHGVERGGLRLLLVRRQAHLADRQRLRQADRRGCLRGRRPEHRRRDYDSYRQATGWMVFGGASASAPLIAATYALLAGAPSSGSYPASFPYASTSALYDVTSGSNGSCSGSYLCTGTTGYDGPTGLGVPNGTAAFTG